MEKDQFEEALRVSISEQELGNYTMAERVPGVRWLMRGEVRSLQEAWNVRKYEAQQCVDSCIEWRDAETISPQ